MHIYSIIIDIAWYTIFIVEVNDVFGEHSYGTQNWMSEWLIYLLIQVIYSFNFETKTKNVLKLKNTIVSIYYTSIDFNFLIVLLINI